MASKGSMHYFNCACGDKSPLRKWTITFPNPSSTRRLKETHCLPAVNRDKHPVLYLHQQHFENPNDEDQDKAILSLTTTSRLQNNPSSVITVSAELNIKKVDQTNNQERKNLSNIFMLLHPILVQPSRNDLSIALKAEDQDFWVDGTNNLFDLAKEDKTILFQCMYGLMTGLSESPLQPAIGTIMDADGSDNRQNAPNNMKDTLSAVFTVTELIRHANPYYGRRNKQRALLKEYISKQLTVNGAPNALYTIFNRLGISHCSNLVRTEAVRSFNKQLEKGYSFANKKYDLFFILFDNLGFRVRGSGRVGYDQYTALQIINVKKEKLIEWGVYPKAGENEVEGK